LSWQCFPPFDSSPNVAPLIAERIREVAGFPPLEAGGWKLTARFSQAFVAHGKGSGHPAGLNFGDRFSYALAKVRGLPLLYQGEDSAQTDIAPALSNR